MKKLAIAVIIASTIIATGCKTNPSSESVDDSNNTDSSNPLSGISKTTGMVIGGITGAVLGNQVGGGNGKTLATVIGAIGGGYLGGELAGDDNQSPKKTQTAQRDDTPEYMKNTQKTVKTSSNIASKFCHNKISYDKTINMDVDVVYIRLKREFDFKTRKEALREAGLDPNCTDDLVCRMDQGYRHTVQSGISYNLSQQVHLNSGNYLGWLHIDLEKAGANKTMVFVNYCNGGTEGFESKYTKVIDNKIKKVYL
ncbi:MAG: glycine zipper 2TM domain-containing protein [gamma proteobacterium symbiont of Bathyaustriella thionipta]|nr:glycine zipper 2TM domain-containing protein [gamma proteobacterium symbiont of Bathyaustriella thionipta]MCU7953063.1 glycine zipper 2TM domain-containing protein [gamma proteobacterium symbiont of Bathyaustriella thionipta]MCU7957574.1 glycine zipper 2TM domain-containing protein [gamma proteobacterium symbiont of Bathyaustriella thionipta]MCU7965844.1 glycine zipper 2TM domain-containing protein [gamma proteobacterium symbiont of Bathyaustriella thionipta]